MYAVKRRWFGGGEGGEEGVWRGVAEGAVEAGERGWMRSRLGDDEDGKELEGWENVVLKALTLCGASGWTELWVLSPRSSARDGGVERGLEMSLLHAAACVGSERVVEWVLENSGERDVVFHSRHFSPHLSPLQVACWAGHLGVVRRLVEKGANVEEETLKGENLLFLASGRGHVEIVRYLLSEMLECGVELDDENGVTPLGAACAAGHLDVVRVLVEEGRADMDVKGRKGKQSPLYLACEGWSWEVVKYLVDSGVGVEGGGRQRGFEVACREGCVDVVRVLLGEGVDVEGVDACGYTPLCAAVEFDRPGVVRVLVEEGGAGVGSVMGGGKTPLDVARRAGYDGIASLLIELGAVVDGNLSPISDT